ncbi:MAG TPA: hypothetical protein DD636_04860 [Anaerolineaceae bacterium]|jgi:hypothetical protein|nr:hypothetical protein [Anaerolineaceae bacterium]
MNEKQLNRVMRYLADDLVAGDVDLWPAIERRFEVNKTRTQKGSSPTFTLFVQKKRLHWVAILTLALLCGSMVLLFTPAGHALAQSVLNFFIRNESNTMPAPTEIPLVWVEQTPGVPAATATPWPGPDFSEECGDYPAPRCTISQIRSKANFSVKELGVIPASMYFMGATGGSDHVFILYDTADHSSILILIEQPWTGSSEQTRLVIGASAIVEIVNIGSGTGEYVKGSFTYRSEESLEHWDVDADSQILRWTEGVIFYQLENFGMQLDRETFVSLSNSLTTEPVSARSTPGSEISATPTEYYDLQADYPLTIAEAGKRTGFTLIQPSKLPGFLSLLGASLEPDQGIVSIFYQLSQDMGPTTNGLVLEEQIIPSTGLYDLSGFIVGENTEIDQYSPGTLVGAFETVQIGEITGQYVEGTWHGTDCCGWVWDADPYLKRLRWQTNGMAFELSYMGTDITQEDLITIAKSMK